MSKRPIGGSWYGNEEFIRLVVDKLKISGARELKPPTDLG